MMTDALHGGLSMEKYQRDNTRYYYVVNENNNSYTLTTYATEGDAYDTESWYKAGEQTYENTDYSYKPGTQLFFGENGKATAMRYSTNGFAQASTSFVFIDGKECDMRFDTGPVQKNLLLTFDYVNSFKDIGSQRCYVSVNDHLIGSFLAEKPEEKKMVIPKEYIADDGRVNIHFFVPDAKSPYEIGTGVDRRTLSLALHAITIDLTDEAYVPEKQTEIKEESEPAQ